MKSAGRPLATQNIARNSGSRHSAGSRSERCQVERDPGDHEEHRDEDAECDRVELVVELLAVFARRQRHDHAGGERPQHGVESDVGGQEHQRP